MVPVHPKCVEKTTVKPKFQTVWGRLEVLTGTNAFMKNVLKTIKKNCIPKDTIICLLEDLFCSFCIW